MSKRTTGLMGVFAAIVAFAAMACAVEQAAPGKPPDALVAPALPRQALPEAGNAGPDTAVAVPPPAVTSSTESGNSGAAQDHEGGGVVEEANASHEQGNEGGPPSANPDGVSDVSESDALASAETIPDGPSGAPGESSEYDPWGDRLFLSLVSPEEDVVFVESGSVAISGVTVVDALVSVNDDLVEVSEEGMFTVTVGLEEGPNIIEVVASDNAGGEEFAVLTIFYLP